MIISNKIGILSALIALSALDSALGHGYMKTPRSRNYHANLNGKWWGGTASDPAPESCPHCLNVGGPGKSVCGKVGDNNYDLPPNAIGGIMPTVIQECYAPGSIIDVESQITAHHKGHFEMYAVSPLLKHRLTFLSICHNLTELVCSVPSATAKFQLKNALIPIL